MYTYIILKYIVIIIIVLFLYYKIWTIKWPLGRGELTAHPCKSWNEAPASNPDDFKLYMKHVVFIFFKYSHLNFNLNLISVIQYSEGK